MRFQIKTKRHKSLIENISGYLLFKHIQMKYKVNSLLQNLINLLQFKIFTNKFFNNNFTRKFFFVLK